MKQTAVEWLVEEIKHIIPSDFLNKFNQAREIEKQQQVYNKEIVDILDNVRYWETCPDEYKVIIDGFTKDWKE